MVAKVRVVDARVKEGFRWVPYYDLKFGDVVQTDNGTKITHPDATIVTEVNSKKQFQR